MDNAPKTAQRSVFVISGIIVLIYSLMSSLSLFMNGDDYLWYSISNYEALSSFRYPNGRYFSNFVTLIIVKYPVVRHIFVFAVLALLVFLLAKVIGFDKKHIAYALPFSLSAIILIPLSTYCETICWISGFTNYVFTAVLILLYLKIVFDVLFSEKSFKPYCFILFPAAALAAGLSVEHVAIYDVILGAAVVVLLWIRRKKLFAAPLLYLVSAVAAVCLVFSNKVYSSISEGNDDFGNRRFEFDFSDLFMNTLRFVIPNYIKPFWVINIVIALSVILLYCSRRPNVKSKYAPICLVIVVLYAVYSVFCSVYSDLAFLEPAMKIRGFETAFTFLYVVALAYFIRLFFDGSKRIRLYIFLLSTVLLTGPFMFISPCTPRCFMENYIFWILLGGDLLFSALDARLAVSKPLSIVCLSATVCLTAFILNVTVTNCAVSYLRYSFIREQIEEGKAANILVIDYPYPRYVNDDMSNVATFDDICVGDETFSYFGFMGDYYGFDSDGYAMKDFVPISSLDYHLLKDEE